MSEAMDAVLNYGFNAMRLHSLEANVDPANAASIKLLEKKGFLKEAHLKENVFFNGRFIDSAIYSLINPGD
jgi:ribosomal-protein-alanine N-acetyltransferase